MLPKARASPEFTSQFNQLSFHAFLSVLPLARIVKGIPGASLTHRLLTTAGGGGGPRGGRQTPGSPGLKVTAFARHVPKDNLHLVNFFKVKVLDLKPAEPGPVILP